MEAGERIAIVGRVASGKSTLGRLLCGLYAPEAGNIFIDGLDSRQHSPTSLRSQFRFVGQDAVLFRGSIKQHMQFCARGASDAELTLILQSLDTDRHRATDEARLHGGAGG